MSITYITQPDGSIVPVDSNGNVITSMLPIGPGTPGASPGSTQLPNNFPITPTLTIGTITTFETVPVPYTVFNYRLYAGLMVSFANQTSQASRYQWFFGDGTISLATSPTHIYASPNTYDVTLRAYAANGSYSDRTMGVVVTSQPAAANFSYVNSGTNVQFTDISTITSRGFLWNFGDGSTSTEQNPYHAYSILRTYNVTLTIDGGSTVTHSINLTFYPFVLSSSTPTPSDYTIAVDSTYVYLGQVSGGTVELRAKANLGVVFGSFATGLTGGPRIAVDGTSIYAGLFTTKIYNKTNPYANTANINDADASHSQGIAVDASNIYIASSSVVPGGHRWNISTHVEDGTISFGAYLGVQVDANYIYASRLPSSGAHIWIYNKTTGAIINSINDASHLKNVPPRIGIDANYIYALTYNGSNYSTVSRYDINTFAFVDIFTLPFDVSGDADNYFAMDPAGGFWVTGPLSGVQTLNYYVPSGPQNILPQAAFSMDVNSGIAPVTVNFTNLSTGSSNTYAWDFGDGVTSATTSPSHIYTQPGSYAVQLTATNSVGSTSVTMGIVVSSGSTLPSPGDVGVRVVGNSLIGASKIGYFVLDTPNNEILIYQADGSLITSFGGFGSAPGLFNDPMALALLGGVQLLGKIEAPPQ